MTAWQRIPLVPKLIGLGMSLSRKLCFLLAAKQIEAAHSLMKALVVTWKRFDHLWGPSPSPRVGMTKLWNASFPAICLPIRYFFLASFAHVSFNVIVRLKTSLPGLESGSSAK